MSIFPNRLGTSVSGKIHALGEAPPSTLNYLRVTIRRGPRGVSELPREFDIELDVAIC